MLMIGMMLDLQIEKSLFKEVIGILITRFSVAIVASAALYFLLPLPLEIRQAISLAVFAPASMTSTALTPGAGGDPAVAAAANSFSILICIPCILTLLTVFGVM